MEKEKKAEEKKEKIKARAVGKELEISTKHAVAICNAIRNKKLEDAQKWLELVVKKKKYIAMKGEIPHRAGGKPGRYPVKAARAFIKLLKQLKANAAVKGLGDVVIVKAVANKAARAARATRLAYGRKKFKRTHIELEAAEK